jgi:GNAT superfamily N-acetyltransferase
MSDIRAALPGDVATIAAVHTAVWPEERARPDYILRCIENSEYAVLVAASDGKVVGFVDGFRTLAQDGTLRWEIDLLAVHPDHQGMGIGASLVNASFESGKERGADIARALVHVENIGSQRTFAGCGFVRQDAVCRLCVAQPSDTTVEAENAHDLHLVQVQTFSYRGLWLEGTLNAATLKAGMVECARQGLDLAGAVIPLGQQDALSAAEQLGFEQIGDYEWWLR